MTVIVCACLFLFYIGVYLVMSALTDLQASVDQNTAATGLLAQRVQALKDQLATPAATDQELADLKAKIDANTAALTQAAG
jgi:predicted PurR-regulated permease PerM